MCPGTILGCFSRDEDQNGNTAVALSWSDANTFSCFLEPPGAVTATGFFNVTVDVHGLSATRSVPFDVPPVVLPARSATMSPVTGVINLTQARRDFTLQVDDISPVAAKVGLDLPAGWSFTQSEGQLHVHAPCDVQVGLYDLALTLDNHRAQTVTHIARDHITPRALVQPASAQVRVVDVTVPTGTVGYIGGGNDRVGHWLDRIGCTVRDLSDAPLTDATLAQCDTLVIGIFAMKFRAGLADAMARIHHWTRAGGTLVTLYHRPWDNWDPDVTTPYRLEIGQPSLRWRVTDEAAAVETLAPEHPVLNTPNQITSADWDHWHKERGLYFAKDWDAAYVPLLSMHDVDEAPLNGALLVADVGQGRHVHTSLILHHQMEKLTSGAFALMANLLAKRS